MIFNGHDLSEYLTVNSVYGRGLASTDVSTIEVPGMDGVHYAGSNRSYRVLDVEYTIKASDPFELRAIIDELNAILDVSEPVPIVFEDEPERTYYGVPEQNSEEREFVRFHKGEISFICPDPYKYGPEKTALFPSSNVILYNEGSADTPPIFEMEVLEPITFAMIQKGEEENAEYQMIGTPAEDDVEIVDTKPLVLTERGETLSEWDTTPIIVDDALISNIDGTMAYDGTGIYAESYGTGTGMHGPAIIREIEPIQDFEIETVFDIISNHDRDNYRMEVYFLDEGLNMLGKMGINDNHRNFTRRIGLARVGERVDSSTRYVIGKNQYQYDNLGRVSLMYLRVRRVGSRYTFYIAEIRNGKHYVPIERSYVDRTGNYTGKLKYIELFIGNWQDRPRTFRTRINYINVYEIKQETVDQTPYIAYPGDLITFDHVAGELLINGEDRTDLKDFGGTYFKLAKGENQLVTFPDGALATQVRFKERFK